jgi:hypothetical protein
MEKLFCPFVVSLVLLSWLDLGTQFLHGQSLDRWSSLVSIFAAIGSDSSRVLIERFGFCHLPALPELFPRCLFFFVKFPLGQSPSLVSCNSLGRHFAWFVCRQDLCTRFSIPPSRSWSWHRPDLGFSAVLLPLSTQWPGQISRSTRLGLLARFPLPLCVLRVAELPARSKAERWYCFSLLFGEVQNLILLGTRLHPWPHQSARLGFPFSSTSFHGASEWAVRELLLLPSVRFESFRLCVDCCR